jgi:tetratricopeptide (TPR) repeat protein
VLRLLDAGTIDGDGVDLVPALSGGTVPARDLYADSFAPLLDFGWAPLRSLRRDGIKLIAAPRPELYDLRADADETRNVVETQAATARALADRVERISGMELPARAAEGPDRDARARLGALGYVGTGRSRGRARPDPKDRIGIASRMAAVIAGELQGADVERTLRKVLQADGDNPQAHLRLGYVLADGGRCADAEPHLSAAIAGGLPSADAHLGLARCQRARGADAAALATLRAGRRAEPGNPTVEANIGLLELDNGRVDEAIGPLTEALRIQPDLHQARFALARALARAGRRAEAERQAADLLSRLPARAPQRPEVERLLAALR